MADALRARRIGLAAGLGAAAASAAAAVVLFVYPPLEVGFYPRCPLFLLTGIYCPGCGALRAAHALLHGHVLEALDFNVFFVLFLPFLAYAAASRISAATRGRALPTVFLPSRAIWALFCVIVAFTVLRNLPYAPFSVLAP